VRTRKTTGEYERIFTAFAAWGAGRGITSLAPIASRRTRRELRACAGGPVPPFDLRPQ
jgi:hypothetical protein